MGSTIPPWLRLKSIDFIRAKSSTRGHSFGRYCHGRYRSNLKPLSLWYLWTGPYFLQSSCGGLVRVRSMIFYRGLNIFVTSDITNNPFSVNGICYMVLAPTRDIVYLFYSL